MAQRNRGGSGILIMDRNGISDVECGGICDFTNIKRSRHKQERRMRRGRRDLRLSGDNRIEHRRSARGGCLAPYHCGEGDNNKRSRGGSCSELHKPGAKSSAPGWRRVNSEGATEGCPGGSNNHGHEWLCEKERSPLTSTMFGLQRRCVRNVDGNERSRGGGSGS